MFKFERELPVRNQIKQLQAYCKLLESEIIENARQVGFSDRSEEYNKATCYDKAKGALDYIVDHLSSWPTPNQSKKSIKLSKQAINAFQELEAKRDFLSKLIEKEQADSKELIEDYDKAIVSFEKLNTIDINRDIKSFHVRNRISFLTSQCNDSQKANEKESFMFYFVALIRQLEDIGINVE